MTERVSVSDHERHDKASRMSSLLELIAQRGRLSVTEAAVELGVSEATVRRDFATLDRQQLATRTHGGLVATSVSYDLPLRFRAGTDVAKARIGAVAAALVERGQVVGFNGGTTVAEVARQIAARSDLADTEGSGSSLTIVTNALNIASELVLRPHLRTVSIGGVARPQSYEVVGALALQALEQLSIDHLLLGVDAIDIEDGVSCHHEGEAGVNALMVARATEVTVVAGSEKLGRRAFTRIARLADLNRLVTDDGAPPELVDALRARGVEVLLA